MISDSPASSRVRIVPGDPDAAYREEFLRLLARLHLERAQAIALVEAATGRPFDSCEPMHLVPLLQQLLELLHGQQARVEADQPWHS